MSLPLSVPYTTSLGYIDHRGYVYGTTMRVEPRDRIISFLLDHHPKSFSMVELCDQLNIAPWRIHKYTLKKYDQIYFAFEHKLAKDRMERSLRQLYMSIDPLFYYNMYQFLLAGGAGQVKSFKELKSYVNQENQLMYGFTEKSRDRDLVMIFLILNKTKTYTSKTIAHEIQVPIPYVVEALKQLKKKDYVLLTKEPYPTITGMRPTHVYRANEVMIPLITAYAKKTIE